MRLIDADALLKHKSDHETISTHLIWNAPTVDAVPVIRCKDCKYYLKSDEKCQLINTRLHFYETDKRWEEYSFCAWAERKEENETL